MACTFSSLIKALRVLILDFDDYLQDDNRLGEPAYLINDQILALLTAYSMYFLMFNQSTESTTSGYWWYFTRPEPIKWMGLSHQRLNTSLINGNGLYFLIINQSTETTNPRPWWWFSRPNLLGWRGLSHQRPNTILINSKRYVLSYV